MSDSTTIAAYREQFERHGLKLPDEYMHNPDGVFLTTVPGWLGHDIGPDASLALCLTTALAAMDWPVVAEQVRFYVQGNTKSGSGPDIHAAVLDLLRKCEPGELR